MAKTGNTLSLDASYGEGAGGVLRTAIQLSCLTQTPVQLSNIRGATQYPGLDNEDIQIIQTLAAATGAEIEGATIGSTSVLFHPTRTAKALRASIHNSDGAVRHANALVVLSSVAPVLAKSGAMSSLESTGETFGNSSLSYDYFENVVARAWIKMGLYIEPKLVEAGFTRDSAGEVNLEIEPSAIQALKWSQRKTLRSAHAILTVCELPGLISARGVEHLQGLAKSAGVPIQIEIKKPSSTRPGAFVTLWAEYENGLGGTTMMGSRGLRMESLVQSAFEQLLNWMSLPATLDQHLCDHILIPAILADGVTQFSVPKLTRRFLSSVWVVKQFLPIRITVLGKEDGPGEVTIQPG